MDDETNFPSISPYKTGSEILQFNAFAIFDIVAKVILIFPFKTLET